MNKCILTIMLDPITPDPEVHKMLTTKAALNRLRKRVIALKAEGNDIRQLHARIVDAETNADVAELTCNRVFEKNDPTGTPLAEFLNPKDVKEDVEVIPAVEEVYEDEDE